jgi:hypothetical protein
MLILLAEALGQHSNHGSTPRATQPLLHETNAPLSRCRPQATTEIKP